MFELKAEVRVKVKGPGPRPWARKITQKKHTTSTSVKTLHL